jgi:hypothetical protein
MSLLLGVSNYCRVAMYVFLTIINAILAIYMTKDSNRLYFWAITFHMAMAGLVAVLRVQGYGWTPHLLIVSTLLMSVAASRILLEETNGKHK